MQNIDLENNEIRLFTINENWIKPKITRTKIYYNYFTLSSFTTPNWK